MKAINLKFQSNKTLSIVQFETEVKNTFKYISLTNAIKNKYAEVQEVSDSGSVNDLTVVNKSEHFIFMSDGEILSGAKQNRVLNTSILVSPKSKIKIPVSCVEQGRWRYKSDKFEETYYSAPVYMRSSKASDVMQSLKSRKTFEARQSNVWNQVSNYESIHEFRSDSSNLSDIFDHKKVDFDDFVELFKPEEGANGIAIFIRNKLLNLEIFNRTDIYEEYFNKLLKGAYFETYRLKEMENTLTEAEAFYKTENFLDSTENINYEEHKSIGAGIEKRFDSEEMTGFELNNDGHQIHFVALHLKNGIDDEKIVTGLDGRKILNFGKYRGRTIHTVQRHDPEYIKWLCFESGIDENVKKEIFEETLRR